MTKNSKRTLLNGQGNQCPDIQGFWGFFEYLDQLEEDDSPFEKELPSRERSIEAILLIVTWNLSTTLM
ncbi:hypothetical protein [Leptospira noguchii]|uniref:hypothetical protein n=1 Tax=Leptospira noguchii TaxID=28182 RepID=UPI0015EF8AFD|nr:hypothetical protein [Leptospira noguchii]